MPLSALLTVCAPVIDVQGCAAGRTAGGVDDSRRRPGAAWRPSRLGECPAPGQAWQAPAPLGAWQLRCCSAQPEALSITIPIRS